MMGYKFARYTKYNSIDAIDILAPNGDTGLHLDVSSAATPKLKGGGDTSGNDFEIYANTNDADSKIKLNGGGHINLYTAATKGLYWIQNSTTVLTTEHSGTETIIQGGTVTSDDFIVRGNSTDTYPYLRWNGNGGYSMYALDGEPLRIYASATSILDIKHSGGEVCFNGLNTNENIFINPDGTGKLKFGTYSAKGAEAFAGYITIVDSGGTSRKLMVCA